MNVDPRDAKVAMQRDWGQTGKPALLDGEGRSGIG